ncbi:MAG: fimbrial biogenesis outer membrane usher protein [Deltaproteobacteria bacterium]|nr:fimbrial biogenesis outer membrane usher protein [Deltaproteobacteria bacterium]
MFSKEFAHRKLRPIAALIMAAMVTKAHAQDTEELILRVAVNTLAKGDFIVLMTPDGDVRLKTRDFARLGIKDPGKHIEIRGEKYVSLKSLEPDVTFKVDLTELKLDIQVSAQLLGETVRDLSTGLPRGRLAKDTSAFFNYAASYETTKDFGAGTFTVPTEIGMRYGDFLLLSTSSFQRNEDEKSFVRLHTSILKDDPEKLRRFTLGDFTGLSGPLGSSVLMGGLSIAKNFAIDPYFWRFASPGFEGIATTPSQIEIYQRGQVLQTYRVPPGRFVLQNLPGAVSGLGEYTIIVKDAFGREQRFDRPYYLASTFLKDGIHDYSYNIGFERKDFGRESFQYGDVNFLAFHNLGLRDRINIGFAAEGSKGLIHFGPTSAFKLGTYGVTGLATAFSHSEGKSGFGGLFAYEFLSRFFSTRMSLRAFSANYLNLSLASATQKTMLEATFSVGLNLERLGFVTGEFTTTKVHAGQGRDRFALSYNKQLTKDLALFLSTSTTKSDRTSTEFFAGLNFFIGRGVSANFSHTTRDGENREALTLLKSAPDTEGLGFRLAAERISPEKDTERIDGNGLLQYNGPYGTYTSEYRRLLGTDNYSFSASGGVAAVGNSFHLTRPISDSFAVVRVAGLKGVEVKFNNRPQGTTGSQGELLLPSILSFHSNKIDIEPAHVPLNYSIDKVTEEVTPLFRSGALVEFKLARIQELVGIIIYLENGQQKPVEYGQLEVLGLERPVEVPIGKEGEFYLENLPRGRYTGRVLSKGRECRINIVIPESDDMTIDLGVVRCESFS